MLLFEMLLSEVGEAQEWGLNNERLGHVTAVPFPQGQSLPEQGGFLGTLGNPSLALPCRCSQFAVFLMPGNWIQQPLYGGNNITELLLLRRKIHKWENPLLIMV